MRQIEKMRQMDKQMIEMAEAARGQQDIQDRLLALRILKAVDPKWAKICGKNYQAAMTAVVAGLERAVA